MAKCIARGAIRAAACKSAVFEDPARTLPEMARIRITTRSLPELQAACVKDVGQVWEMLAEDVARQTLRRRSRIAHRQNRYGAAPSRVSRRCDVFDAFEKTTVETKGAVINLVRAGRGPPLLLLHGYP